VKRWRLGYYLKLPHQAEKTCEKREGDGNGKTEKRNFKNVKLKTEDVKNINKRTDLTP
jgi:hypothetical protein